MEPVSLITTLAVAFARGAGSKAMGALGSAFGLGGGTEVKTRLLAIETALDDVLRAPHQENLRAGTVLLRESLRQQDATERRRRLLVAEDRLVVAASDTHLGLEERAGAALLTALSAAERGAAADSLRWLQQCSGLLSTLVQDRLHHQKAIMAATAPPWVAADVERQRAAQRLKVLLGTWSPELGPLRVRVRGEAHDALALWNAIRPFLAAAERPASYPGLTITDHDGTYVPGAPVEFIDLTVVAAGAVGVPVTLGAHRLTVGQVQRDLSVIDVSGRLERDPALEQFRAPSSAAMAALFAPLKGLWASAGDGTDWSGAAQLHEPSGVLVCVRAPAVTAATDFSLTVAVRSETETLCVHLDEGLVRLPLPRRTSLRGLSGLIGPRG